MYRPFKRLSRMLARRILTLPDELAITKALVADLLIAQQAKQGVLSDIQNAEFKVSSQFGEDGIIQYLIRHADVPRECRTFVEFGVGS